MSAISDWYDRLRQMNIGGRDTSIDYRPFSEEEPQDPEPTAGLPQLENNRQQSWVRDIESLKEWMGRLEHPDSDPFPTSSLQLPIGDDEETPPDGGPILDPLHGQDWSVIAEAVNWTGGYNKKGQMVGEGTMNLPASGHEVTCNFRKGQRNGKFIFISDTLEITVRKSDIVPDLPQLFDNVLVCIVVFASRYV